MPTATSQSTSLSEPLDLQRALAELEDVRARTLALIAHLDAEQLERTHSAIMSPLVWDLAHIAAYEELWLVCRHGGGALVHPELAERYDAFETPRAVRGEIELLDSRQALEYLSEVREHTIRALRLTGLGDGVLFELVLRHELQHTETMRQTMAIAGLLPAGEPRLGWIAGTPEWISLEAGAFLMGAGDEGFAYDNERPQHTTKTGAFQIASQPTSNSSWLGFIAEGGYEERRWWSCEGWAWREEQGANPEHPGIAEAPLNAPVCHISFYEAQAFASAHEARLPTEFEWERACAHSQPISHTGAVWEWTSSIFEGYPGFTAYPYREYSEVFFHAGYRVLRGGSWASDPRVAKHTFRNWDHPQRRQIFAGVRLAKDL